MELKIHKDKENLKTVELVSDTLPNGSVEGLMPVHSLREAFDELLRELTLCNNLVTGIDKLIFIYSECFGKMTGSDKDLWWFVEKKMSEFIMEHRPGLLIKIDYTPQVDTVPRDRLYQVNTSHRCLNPAPFCWVSGYQWWQEKNY